MEGKMTIFYSKSSGEVKGYTGGETNMRYFGTDEEDFTQIYDYVVVESDEYVMDNSEQFEIVNKEVKFIQPDIPDKYL